MGLLRGLPSEERTTLARPEELRNLLSGKVDYYAPDRPEVPTTSEDIHVDFDRPQAELHAGLMGRLPLALRLKLRFNTGLSGYDLQRLRSFLTGPRQLSISDATLSGRGGPLSAFNRSAKLRRAHAELHKTLDTDPRTKALVWAPYVRAGLEPYAAKLREEGTPFVTYHGGMSDAERKAAVEAFNSGRARVALLAPAAAEGLTFKGAQLMQVLGAGWHETQTDQAIARGLRHGSHDGLPPELQRYHVQRFYSRLPLGTRDRFLEWFGADRTPQRLATDDYLRALGQKKRTANEELLELLKDVGTQKPDTRVSPKTAAQSPTVTALLQAKAYSDMRNYAAKAHIVRALVQKSPHDWFVDSHQSHTVGLTHRRSGFRLHIPKSVIADLAIPGYQP